MTCGHESGTSWPSWPAAGAVKDRCSGARRGESWSHSGPRGKAAVLPPCARSPESGQLGSGSHPTLTAPWSLPPSSRLRDQRRSWAPAGPGGPLEGGRALAPAGRTGTRGRLQAVGRRQMSASRKHLGAGDPFRRAGPPWEASELLCPREWSVLEALPWVGGWHGGRSAGGAKGGWRAGEPLGGGPSTATCQQVTTHLGALRGEAGWRPPLLLGAQSEGRARAHPRHPGSPREAPVSTLQVGRRRPGEAGGPWLSLPVHRELSQLDSGRRTEAP